MYLRQRLVGLAMNTSNMQQKEGNNLVKKSKVRNISDNCYHSVNVVHLASFRKLLSDSLARGCKETLRGWSGQQECSFILFIDRDLETGSLFCMRQTAVKLSALFPGWH